MATRHFTKVITMLKPKVWVVSWLDFDFCDPRRHSGLQRWLSFI